MANYNVYLCNDRRIYVVASKHIAYTSDQHPVSRVDFLNDKDEVVASFGAPALEGFIESDHERS